MSKKTAKTKITGKLVLYLSVIALAVPAMNVSVWAQLPPPVSPWMGMFDRPLNPTFGNYLGNVRPRQELQRTQAAQTSQLQTQQRALQALQQGGGAASTSARDLVGGAVAPAGGATSLRDVLAPPRERPSMQSPAGFNQYLHYYPPGSMPRRPVPNFSTQGRK